MPSYTPARERIPITRQKYGDEAYDEVIEFCKKGKPVEISNLLGGCIPAHISSWIKDKSAIPDAIMDRWPTLKHNPEIIAMNGRDDVVKAAPPRRELIHPSGRFQAAPTDAAKVPETPGMVLEYEECYVPDPEKWTGKQLIILFPCYRTTNPLTMASMMNLMSVMESGKWGFSVQWATMIQRARNMLAHKFLASGAEWSLWVDDDMVPVCGQSEWWKTVCYAPKDFPNTVAGQHAIYRLLSHRKKIVSGLYFGRGPGSPAMFSNAMRKDEIGTVENKRAHEAPANKLVRADWCATGFLLVHRDVYLKIIEDNQELKPANPNVPFPFFDPEPGKGGEDEAFGRRASASGFESWVDFNCPVTHMGSMPYNMWNTK